MAESSCSSTSGLGSGSSSSSEEIKLLPFERGKSGVWAYFGFAAKNGEYIKKEKRKRSKVICRLCRKQLHYVGNTTNLLVHMQYHHVHEYSKLPKGTQPKATAKTEETQQVNSGNLTQVGTPSTWFSAMEDTNGCCLLSYSKGCFAVRLH